MSFHQKLHLHVTHMFKVLMLLNIMKKFQDFQECERNL